jgi:hypothetical protein
VAIWDVTRRGRWHPYLRREVTDVVMHYRPWWEDEVWCSRITLGFGASKVELVLAEADRDGQIRPSSDNVAVVFDGARLPGWAGGEG